MSLDQIITEVQNLPSRTLLYGIDGIGKTTWAADAPAPIFVCTEEGATRVPVPKFPLCSNWSEILDCLRVLCREQHDYKTLVLDSADWAQALAIKFVCERDYGSDMGAFDSYGRGYKAVLMEWIKLLSALDHLRRTKGMEIIVIAHAVVRTFKNPMGDDYDKYESNLHSGQSTSIWAKTKEWADMVLFASYEVLVRKDNAKAPKGKGIMVAGDGSRVCHAAPSASWDAKVRAGWSLPAKFQLDQAIFRNHLNKETSDAV
jgi:hypothetical protein